MPTLLREGGFTFRFRASDGTEPPHVHVTGNGGRAKVWLRTIELIAVWGYDVKEQGDIRNITREHRDEWLEAWARFFSDG